eukprot:487530-Pleurochrysis_carterae.AAC.2
MAASVAAVAVAASEAAAAVGLALTCARAARRTSHCSRIQPRAHSSHATVATSAASTWTRRCFTLSVNARPASESSGRRDATTARTRAACARSSAANRRLPSSTYARSHTAPEAPSISSCALRLTDDEAELIRL